MELDKDQSKKLDELIKLTVNTQVNEKSNSTNMLIHYDDSEIFSLANIFKKILDGTKIDAAAKEFKPKSKASDIALFGRMLAENTDFNVDAACQVAHAISTHKVNMEMDFFTAIDDLKKDFSSGDAGAGMMGTVEFDSACFYRYSVIDAKQLEKNLDGDKELTKKTIKAFIQSSIASIPTGKQNSMAAQNPPSFVMVVVKDGCPWSLANAFEVPITHGTEGIIAKSIRRFDLYWGRLQSVYGSDGIVSASFINLEQANTPNIDAFKVENKDQLIAKTIEAIGNA
jgi:CRISPR system Cascade subunit CasC